MLSNSFLPESKTLVEYFQGRSSASREFDVWYKPRNKSMAYIVAVGRGGNGGTGVIGANLTAAGGGGGGSGGHTSLFVPLCMLPDTLYICGSTSSLSTAFPTTITISPFTTINANHTVILANSGTNGGNASGATAGAAGAGATAATIAGMPLGTLRGLAQFSAGQVGVIGGTTGNSGAPVIPTTGLFVTGGQGGAGLPATATNGSVPGAWTVPANTPNYMSWFPSVPAPAAASSATTPPIKGMDGAIVSAKNNESIPLFFYGGQGGASTHGSANTTGLVQAGGGMGAPGCGGGGMGGALTGSTAATVALGGPGFVYIITW